MILIFIASSSYHSFHYSSSYSTYETYPKGCEQHLMIREVNSVVISIIQFYYRYLDERMKGNRNGGEPFEWEDDQPSSAYLSVSSLPVTCNGELQLLPQSLVFFHPVDPAPSDLHPVDVLCCNSLFLN